MLARPKRRSNRPSGRPHTGIAQILALHFYKHTHAHTRINAAESSKLRTYVLTCWNPSMRLSKNTYLPSHMHTHICTAVKHSTTPENVTLFIKIKQQIRTMLIASAWSVIAICICHSLLSNRQPHTLSQFFYFSISLERSLRSSSKNLHTFMYVSYIGVYV